MDLGIFYVLRSALHNERPSGTPSFASRRKIEEKGVPRRRKLHILRFAFRGKSSVIPLLLLSPPNPLALGFGGAPVSDPLESTGVNGLEDSDVLCANRFPQGDFLRARNGTCDAIKSRMACTSALLPCALRAAVPRKIGKLTQPPDCRVYETLVIL